MKKSANLGVDCRRYYHLDLPDGHAIEKWCLGKNVHVEVNTYMAEAVSCREIGQCDGTCTKYDIDKRMYEAEVARSIFRVWTKKLFP